MQIHAYKFNSVPPPFDKMDADEKKQVLQKFTKANLKLNIPLELNQLVSLLDHFIECTMTQIAVSFKNWQGLKEMIDTFSSSDVKAASNGKTFDLQPYVEVKMKHQNAFACFLFFLERKF